MSEIATISIGRADRASMASKGSSKELDKSFNIARKTAYLVGINQFIPEREVNIRFVGSVMLMTSVYLMSFYTLWVKRSDWQGIAEVLLVLLLVVQGTNKIWVGFVHKSRYCQLFKDTAEIYAHFDADERNRPILKRTVDMLAFSLRAMVILYITAGVMMVLFVVLVTLITGEKFFCFTLFIPFVDHTTTVGYMITSGIHMILVVLWLNGYLASDTNFMANVMPIIGYSNSFRNEITNFNIFLKYQIKDEKQIAEKLVHICQLHQMIVKYEINAIEHFKSGNVIQIGFQACTILATVFMGYIYQYLQGIAMMVAVLFELTQFCALGTIITAKNEQMCRDIYDIDWHLLKKPQQHIVAFMLHQSQIPKDLTAGGFAPLNMTTYVQVLKTIYTFFTMLITVLE
ncbi:putative odorant receptor 71a [Malaya genurostris]|uniref:putative odorant receptor 71a n=1 Tax=Malaya genurostris TaxID=325434 RepID=UPI0026F3B19E|nr:putative odorant receptor 71a [Malaya genurostris]